MPISYSNEDQVTASSEQKLPTAGECRRAHFFLAQRFIDIISNAIDDELEPFRYVQTLKDGSATVLDCSTLPALNEDRLAKMVKILGELFELQRCAVGIPCVKEKNDLLNNRKKLEQERYIADRKLDFELIKLEREFAASDDRSSGESFFKALGAVIPGEVEDDEYADDSNRYY